jgi:hypothetical protein
LLVHPLAEPGAVRLKLSDQTFIAPQMKDFIGSLAFVVAPRRHDHAGDALFEDGTLSSTVTIRVCEDSKLL